MKSLGEPEFAGVRVASTVDVAAGGGYERDVDVVSLRPADFMTGDPAFANEKPDYLHLTTTILPRLLEAGVTEAQIEQMMVDNPRRFFAPRPA